MTKTYFMAWESDNKRGHYIGEAPAKMPAGEVLKQMIDQVYADFKDKDLKGVVTARQFNVVG